MKKIVRILIILLLSSPVVVSGQSAKQYYKVSLEFIKNGNYQDAISQLTKALEIDPKYADAYIRRGEALEKINNKSEALEDYKRAIVFLPKEAEVFVHAAKVSFALNRYEDALNYANQTLAIDRGDLGGLEYKIRSLVSLDRANEAVPVCETALTFKENAVNLFLAGVVQEKMRNFEKAEYNYEKAISKDKNYTDAYLALSLLRIQLNKLDQALEKINILLAKEPENTNAYLVRSKIYAKRIAYPDAINDVSKAILISPDNSQLYYARGCYYQEFTQHQSAINDFNKVLLLDNQNAEAFYRRAKSNEEIGNFKAAVKDYEALVKLSDSDARAKKLLDDAKKRLFELNRETNLPQVIINNPDLVDKSLVQLPVGKNIMNIKGHINDESEIKYLKINDKNIPFVKNEDGYNFIAETDLMGKDEFVLTVADIYENVLETRYHIIRTEITPPVLSLLAPYASDNNEVYMDTPDPSLYIEGTIKDDSKIRSILIDGVAASYKLDELNPTFSATIDVLNKNGFTVTATDIYGNSRETNYKINRQGAEIAADNPMGKTWAVFIENSNYQTFASLEGPTKDIILMKTALVKYKFNNIIHKKDMTKKDLDRFFSIELRDLVRSNRVNALLIWYAGHGKYINETGYWIPVDANRDDEFTYYNINNLKAALQTYSSNQNTVQHTLVVTDACESGPTFYQAMRGAMRERNCSDLQVTRLKSSQVFSSAGYELAVDNSQFTKTFATMLVNNNGNCIPIESIVNTVTSTVVQNSQQRPKFGKIAGLADEDGTFFFMPKQ